MMVPEITPGPELPAPPALGARLSLRQLELNLPNLITLARLLSVPVVVWLILEERFAAAFWMFIGAGISDALDGYIAKRFNRRTRLGAVLDPAADKALLAGVFVTLWFTGQLPGWLVALVIGRDLMIVLGFAALQGAGRTGPAGQFGPLFVSKVNTLVQIALVGFVLARLGLGSAEAGAATWLLVAAAATTTLLSGWSYVVRWTRVRAGSEPAL